MDKFNWKLAELVAGQAALAGQPVLPFYNLKQMYDNMEKASEAQTTGELVLRMLNYSDYQIKGPEEKEKLREEKAAPKIFRKKTPRSSIIRSIIGSIIR